MTRSTVLGAAAVLCTAVSGAAAFSAPTSLTAYPARSLRVGGDSLCRPRSRTVLSVGKRPEEQFVEFDLTCPNDQGKNAERLAKETSAQAMSSEAVERFYERLKCDFKRQFSQEIYQRCETTGDVTFEAWATTFGKYAGEISRKEEIGKVPKKFTADPVATAARWLLDGSADTVTLRRLFDELDVDGNGRLSKAEIDAGLAAIDCDDCGSGPEVKAETGPRRIGSMPNQYQAGGLCEDIEGKWKDDMRQEIRAVLSQMRAKLELCPERQADLEEYLLAKADDDREGSTGLSYLEVLAAERRFSIGVPRPKMELCKAKLEAVEVNRRQWGIGAD